MKNLKTISAFLTVFTLVFVMGVSHASMFSFEKITSNNNVDLTGQLSLDVVAIGNTGIEFTFYNNVGLDSSLTDIYFDLAGSAIFSGVSIIRDSDGFGDATYTAANSLQDMTDVYFKDGAKTAVLPGANGNPINFTSDYDAGAKNVKKGLDQGGEWVTFLATLGGNFTYDNYLAGLADGSYRIGVKLQSIASACANNFNDCSNDSSTYLVSAVPVPAAAWLFGTALFGFFASTKRKKIS